MKTLATKQSAQNVIQQKSATPQPAPASFGQSLSLLPRTGILQRKTSCACGGGCPRCQKKPDLEERLPIQTKLKISQPGDKYEQEADRVSEEVVQQIHNPPPEPLQHQLLPENENQQLHRQPTVPPLSPLQSVPAGTGPRVSPNLESAVQQARGGGQALPDSMRLPLERGFGADFSRVRVHADHQAEQLNQSLQANAFTTGQDIFFRPQTYQPNSLQGQRLLAHELAHVVQQSMTGPSAARPVQCQHIRLVSGRYVGDIEGFTVNQREDVLDVLARLYHLQSLTQTAYDQAYRRIRALPLGQAVNRSQMSEIIAAIQDNEAPVLTPEAAQNVLNLEIEGNVGAGQPNRRADVLSVQDALHRLWYLSSDGEYERERRAIDDNQQLSQIPDRLIPHIIAAIPRMKLGYVTGAWRGRGALSGPWEQGPLAGVRILSEETRQEVETALARPLPSPAAPSGSEAPDLQRYRDAIASELEQVRTSHSVSPSHPRSEVERSNLAPLARLVERKVEQAFSDYLEAGITHRPNLPLSPRTLEIVPIRSWGWQEVKTYLSILIRTRPTFLDIHRRYSQPANNATINAFLDDYCENGTCQHQAQWVEIARHSPEVVVSAEARRMFETTYGRRSFRPETIELVTLVEGIPSSEVAAAERDRRYRRRRESLWLIFQTLIHEYIHVLDHPNYSLSIRDLPNPQNEILKEGVTEHFAFQVWDRIARTIAQDARLREVVEGASFPYDATVIPNYRRISIYRNLVTRVQEIETMVGMANLRAAYFLGDVRLIGLETPGRFRIPDPPTLQWRMADVAYFTGNTMETIERLNPRYNRSTILPPQESLVIRQP